MDSSSGHQGSRRLLPSHGFNSPEWIHHNVSRSKRAAGRRTALTALNGFIGRSAAGRGRSGSHGFNSPEWIHLCIFNTEDWGEGRTALTALNGFISMIFSSRRKLMRRTALTALNGFIKPTQEKEMKHQSHGFNSPEWIHPRPGRVGGCRGVARL